MEIYGCGIDITPVARIAASCEKGPFLSRYFTQQEQDYFSRFSSPYPHIAGFFCAKEAFSKALGTGIRGFSLTDVAVDHEDNGKPFLVFHGKLKEQISALGLDFILTISHCEEYAVAHVTALVKGAD